mgnify:CR=1 FL=1
MTKTKRSILILISALSLAISSLACADPGVVVIETITTVQVEIQEGVCTGADAVGAETGTLCK